MHDHTHGDWQLDMHGPVMALTLFSGFNSRGVTALHLHAAEVLAQAMALGLKPPLAAIADLRPWQLITADAEPALKNMIERMAMVGFSHVAYISGGTLRQQLLERLWQPWTMVNRYYCNTPAEGCAWLAAAGFTPPASDG